MSDVEIRRGSALDFPGVLELARRALQWNDDDASFLEWKHLQNPFGVSPMWVALDGDRIVGFRTFLRWQFVTPAGGRVVAARAVDTATDPDHQGRGIFRTLTLRAIDELPSLGVQMIFNTPNEKSLPGYLGMGWTQVGRLSVAARPARPRFAAVVATARVPAERWPVPTDAGVDPHEAFVDADLVDALLGRQPLAPGLATDRSAEFLRWRYGNRALGYRVVLRSDDVSGGFAVFRRRRRGRAIEGVLSDLVAPAGDPAFAHELLEAVGRAADVDYLLRVDDRRVTRDGFLRLPRVGPVLACRPLDGSRAPELARWALNMGDVELF